MLDLRPTWQVPGVLNDLRTNYKLGPEQEIEGGRRAWRLDRLDDEGGKVRSALWIAPSAGYLVVRDEMRSKLPAGPFVEKGMITLLDSVFEPAKGLMVPMEKHVLGYVVDAQGKRWWMWLFRYSVPYVSSVRANHDLSDTLFGSLFLPLGTMTYSGGEGGGAPAVAPFPMVAGGRPKGKGATHWPK